MEMKAGQVSCTRFAARLGDNLSRLRRCGLTLRYFSADVTAGLGWNAKGVIVSGVDPSGHWGNAPRPATD